MTKDPSSAKLNLLLRSNAIERKMLISFSRAIKNVSCYRTIVKRSSKKKESSSRESLKPNASGNFAKNERVVLSNV